MLLTVVKFTVRPERSEQWLDLVDDYTLATRREPGTLFAEWSRSTDVPHQFVLVAAFASAEARAAHTRSAHFAAARSWLPGVLARTPDVVRAQGPGAGWIPMRELRID
ncbi:hypothetical protein GCM10022222_56590 [Amycolatopsis ultiminotia]|uniref:ABM domain-containing protein n=1 Tax=Amycolatopsis ultiminotia TaxID=543629 RepID=A0ABP6XEE0_9PSEU